MPTGQTYVLASARRYPFMLAKLQPSPEELSLCFGPTSGPIGEFDEGQPPAPFDTLRTLVRMP